MPTTVPGIAKLRAIVAGFILHVKRPSSNGGSAITSYQYSLNGGSRWYPLAGGSTVLRVTNLVRGHGYRVIVRAVACFDGFGLLFLALR